MLKSPIRSIVTLIIACAISMGFISYSAAEESAESKKKTNQLQQRIDFGNAYILGQSIKSGAVYLLHRKQSEIKGMLKVRSDYRKEIMEDYALEDSAITSKQNQKEKAQE